MADMNEMMRRLLYYPDRLPRDLPPPAWAGRCEEVRLECEDGLNIHGLWWPEPEGAPVILFFHGNAQEAYSWSPVHSELEPLGCRLLLIDYHGYGKSDGEPGRRPSTWTAGPRWPGWPERGIADGDIIVFGKSLGGAVACEIARERALPRPGAGVDLHLPGQRGQPPLPHGPRGAGIVGELFTPSTRSEGRPVPCWSSTGTGTS